MSPGRILGGRPQHQVSDLPGKGWPPGTGVRVRPMAGDQLAVPPQQRCWRDKEDRATRAGEQPRQRRQHHAIGGLEPGRRTYRRRTAT
jgi:hypothetical protein